MYYRDGTPYRYREALIGKGLVNIGWLGYGLLDSSWVGCLGFRRGALPPEALDALFEFCRHPVEQLRGFHDCGVCGHRGGFTASRNGLALTLGSAEIRVLGRDGRVFSAPNLIYHYVADHHYRPPTEFVEALLTSPRPGSAEYATRTKSLGTAAEPIYSEWDDSSPGTSRVRGSRASGPAGDDSGRPLPGGGVRAIGGDASPNDSHHDLAGANAENSPVLARALKDLLELPGQTARMDSAAIAEVLERVFTAHGSTDMYPLHGGV